MVAAVVSLHSSEWVSLVITITVLIITIVTLDNTLLLERGGLIFRILYCLIPADCGDPSPPANGFVMVSDSTLEGSQIVFQCNSGLAPSQQMMSVCAANGSWTPDPAELVCMSPPPGILNAVCRVHSCCFVPVSNIKQALHTALVKRKLRVY